VDYMNALEKRVLGGTLTVAEYENGLEKIADAYQAHSADPDVLTAAAKVCDALGELELTGHLLRSAVELKRDAETLLRMARVDRELGHSDGTKALAAVFDVEDVTSIEIRSAVRQLREHAPERLVALPSSAAYKRLSLDERAALAQEVLWDGCEHVSLAIVNDILADIATGKSIAEGTNSLTLCMIGLGMAGNARSLLEASVEHGLPFQFNHAMATWADTKQPPVDRFSGLIEQMNLQPGTKSANFWQCLALLCGASKDEEGARIALHKSRQRLRLVRMPEFSAWQYRTCSPLRFEADLDEMAQTSVEHWLPVFVKRSSMGLDQSTEKSD
jgi:hypothetical protein